MFKRLFKRLSRDEGEFRADSIRAWAATVPGVTMIADARPRVSARIAGQVDSVRVRPREGVEAFEATLTDGTGTLFVVWLGRRTVPGLTIGSRLIVEGTLGGSPGQLQVMNPRYEFAATEEH